ncbi:hypothetical protein CRG98_028796 [Punica granatum]|uniref:Retrotransposon Copia-like N-terminal domain-containing protein n=1 Tax=Punica granatum TaxID=22663 RepID=A0A2I0J3K5_PUNGR|nr:hypothetical protein CRG98_028796 [Punica granatum]
MSNSMSTVSVSPIYGSPVISTIKLNGKTFSDWKASVELWFLGQGHMEHLTKDVSKIEESKKATWIQIDAYLCTLLWQSIDPSLMSMFRPYKTCKSVWTRVKEVYTRDITRVYDVLSNLFQLKLLDTDMHTHLARLQGLFTEFDESLGVEYEHVRSQILSGEAIPPLADVIARLIRVTDISQTPCTVEEKVALAIESNSSSATSSSVGVAYSHKGHRASKGGKGRGNPPTCTYCGRRSHSREKCYSLHGFPPKVANTAQVQVSVDTDSSSSSYRGTPAGPSSSVVISAEDYAQFTHLLQNRAVKQTSHPPIVSFAQSGQPIACLTKSSPIGSWVLTSGASDHMSGNSSLLSHFHNASSLPSVTLANGSIASDSRTGGTIGMGREFQGLYRLSAPVTSEVPIACTVAASPEHIHSRLVHPSLANLKQMVPSLSKFIKTFGVLVQFLQVKVIVIL